jgi:hypothetical protein
MRICFVGNSHVAAAKFGWDSIAAQNPEIEVSFFGATASVFENIAVENGRLVGRSEEARQSLVKTSGGRDAAVFENYDLVVLCGLDFGLWRALKLYAKFRWGDQKNAEGEFDYVSTGYLHEIVKVRFARTTAIRFREDIRRDCGARSPKVWIYPEPMPSHLVLTASLTEKSDFSTTLQLVLRQAAEWHDEASLSVAYSVARDALSDDVDYIFEQPPQTLDGLIFTRGEYSKEHLFSKSQTTHKEDYVHMNARFGELMIRQLLERARADLAASAPDAQVANDIDEDSVANSPMSAVGFLGII